MYYLRESDKNKKNREVQILGFLLRNNFQSKKKRFKIEPQVVILIFISTFNSIKSKETFPVKDFYYKRPSGYTTKVHVIF